MQLNQAQIAVLIPCRNEEKTIGSVIKSFQSELPLAKIYVYDNLSEDKTSDIAKKNGAIVGHVSQVGKGNVVKRMFSEIEAEIYIMVDGDGTYDSKVVNNLISELTEKKLDMVIGARTTKDIQENSRGGHLIGNWMLTKSVSFIFGRGFNDMLSGYRVMTKPFVKSFPVESEGFEIETELTIHSLQLGSQFKEVYTNYYPRPEGSNSKLSTWRDGFKILFKILSLFKNLKPLMFYSLIFFLMLSLSLILVYPVLDTWLQTGLVPRLPTAILSMGIVLVGIISLILGIILESISQSRLENKKLIYQVFKSF